MCLLCSLKWFANHLLKIALLDFQARKVDPELGVNFYFGPVNLRKVDVEFLSEFFQRIFSANFSANFIFQGFRAPKQFTLKIVGFPLQFHVFEPKCLSSRFLLTGENKNQKTADVWKKDVWDFQAFSQTFLALQFSLGNEGKGSKNLNS